MLLRELSEFSRSAIFQSRGTRLMFFKKYMFVNLDSHCQGKTYRIRQQFNIDAGYRLLTLLKRDSVAGVFV